MSILERSRCGCVVVVSLAIWSALASGSSSATAQTSLAGRVPACKVSQLAAAEDHQDSDQIDGGAGHHALTIIIQNRLLSPCILRGVPKLELLYSANHRAFPVQSCANCSDYLFRRQPVTDILLKPGRSAYLVLGFDISDGNGPCTKGDPKYARFEYSDMFLNLYLSGQPRTPLRMSLGEWRSCGAIDVTPFLKQPPKDGLLPAPAQ
jgi:hypothetical protein